MFPNRRRIVSRYNPVGAGNLNFSNNEWTINEQTTGSNCYAKSTPAVYKRKLYWEVTVSAAGTFNCALGIRGSAEPASTAVNLGKTCAMRSTATLFAGDTGATTGAGATFATGNVLMFALDGEAQKFWIGVNGTWANSGNPAAGAGALFSSIGDRSWEAYAWTDNDVTGEHTFVAGFGQVGLSYAPPVGFERGLTY